MKTKFVAFYYQVFQAQTVQRQSITVKEAKIRISFESVQYGCPSRNKSCSNCGECVSSDATKRNAPTPPCNSHQWLTKACV